jgi:hypothetical protein
MPAKAGIQYARAVRPGPYKPTTRIDYWIARSSRAMTKNGMGS